MSVTSYLALYTTILGWQQYQNLWNIMTGTGLVYLPFVSIILMSTLKPFLSMGAKDFAVISVRRMLIQILSSLIIIAVCAVPMITLDPTVLTFQPTCNPTAPVATPGNTGTTYDDAFQVPTGVQIPLFWYLVMAVSNGFTQAANEGLSCAPLDYRALHAELNLATIQDANLKQEVGNFYQQCYVPAYGRYLSGNLSAGTQSQVASIQKQYGQDDVSWMGSQVFQQVPGFYDSLSATSPVNGFPFDPTRDQTEAQVPNHSQWGEPSCKDWWTDTSNGLHNQLLNQFPPSFIQQLLSLGSSAAEMEDQSIRHLIQYNVSTPLSGSTPDQVRGYTSLANDNNPISTALFDHLLGSIGVAIASVVGFTTIHLIVNALPVIQAALLFCLYTFLAIAMPFASFRPSFIITAAIVMFSVIFCSYIWHLVAWFDAHLMEAMFPPSNYLAIAPDFFGVAEHATSEMFVNLIIGAMYLTCPVFFMVVLTWAGLQAGAVFGAILGPMSGAANAAGSAGGNAAMGAMKSSVGAMGS